VPVIRQLPIHERETATSFEERKPQPRLGAHISATFTTVDAAMKNA
jgi:hypothetical protein